MCLGWLLNTFTDKLFKKGFIGVATRLSSLKKWVILFTEWQSEWRETPCALITRPQKSEVYRWSYNKNVMLFNFTNFTLFAVSNLGPTISIRRSWRGFPTTVTAAVSIPTRRQPEGYKYYVFSRCKLTTNGSCCSRMFIFTRINRCYFFHCFVKKSPERRWWSFSTNLHNFSEFTALSSKTFQFYVNLIHFMLEPLNKDHVWCGCRGRVGGVVLVVIMQMGRTLRVASSHIQVSTLMIIPVALTLNGSE